MKVYYKCKICGVLIGCFDEDLVEQCDECESCTCEEKTGNMGCNRCSEMCCPDDEKDDVRYALRCPDCFFREVWKR